MKPSNKKEREAAKAASRSRRNTEARKHLNAQAHRRLRRKTEREGQA